MVIAFAVTAAALALARHRDDARVTVPLLMAVTVAVAVLALAELGMWGDPESQAGLRHALSTHVAAVAGWLVGASLVGVVAYQLRRRPSWRGPLSVGTAAVLMATASAVTLAFPEPEQPALVPLEIQLDEQVALEVVATGLTRPTAMVWADDTLLVAEAGRVVTVDPTSGRVQEWATDTGLVLGTAWSDGRLFATSGEQVLAIEDRDGDGRADVRSVLVDGLPAFVYTVHAPSAIAIHGGRLLVGVGGTSDIGPEDHPLAGSILAVEVGGGTEPTVYASGLRNPYDLAICDGDQLFATDNGPDGPPKLAYTPPDEVNLIDEGADYGYPDVFGDPPAGHPSRAPFALLPQHAAATGITCYEGNGARALPIRFRDGLVVTLWNTEPRNPLPGAVVRVDRSDPERHLDVVVEGLDGPIDVLEDRDGALLVLEHGAGRLVRLTSTSGS